MLILCGIALPANLYPDLHAEGSADGAAGAAPRPAAEDPGALEPVSDEELSEQRGGFRFQGVDISLGAEIRTFIDGELVLQTNVSWGAGGAASTQIVSGALTQVDAAQLQAGILTSGGITMRVGGQSVYLANGGQTALMHRTDGALQNVIVNTASNVKLTQEVDAALNLGNFRQFQDDVLRQRLADSIGDTIGQAAAGGCC